MSQRILVLDCYRHTLTVLRSLSLAGYKVTLGVTADELERGYVHFSRHVTSTWLHPDIVDDPVGFNTAFLEFLNGNPDLQLVYPVGENAVRRVASIRADVPSGVLITMPENDAVETCLNKPSAYKIAKRCQIPVPTTRTVKSANELRDAVRELGLPSIIKASDSKNLSLNKKCVFVRTGSDMEALIDNWSESSSIFIVQNEIKGTRYNCDIVAENGQIRLYFESEIIRTDRLDHSGYAVSDRSVAPNRNHREYCQRFVMALNYTGLALIQFLRDDHTGNSYFLEANPRTGATIALAAHCGINLPAVAVGVHIGASSVCDTSYPSGVSKHWLYGDVLGLHRARKSQEIGLKGSLAWLASTLTDFFHADCHTTFSWRDPKPTIALFWCLLVRSLHRGR